MAETHEMKTVFISLDEPITPMTTSDAPVQFTVVRPDERTLDAFRDSKRVFFGCYDTFAPVTVRRVHTPEHSPTVPNVLTPERHDAAQQPVKVKSAWCALHKLVDIMLRIREPAVF